MRSAEASPPSSDSWRRSSNNCESRIEQPTHHPAQLIDLHPLSPRCPSYLNDNALSGDVPSAFAQLTELDDL